MTRTTRFVIAGFGNVGGQIAKAVLADRSRQLEIAAIAARDLAKARAKAEGQCWRLREQVRKKGS